MLIGPSLLVWWLRGRFDVYVVVIGGSISVALLLGCGLALGWAVGRIGDRRRR